MYVTHHTGHTLAVAGRPCRSSRKLDFSVAYKHQIIQGPITTSNVTVVTEVQSTSAGVAGTWRPMVSVITTLYYVVIIFHCRVWYSALFVRVYSSPRTPLCQILFLLRLC